MAAFPAMAGKSESINLDSIAKWCLHLFTFQVELGQNCLVYQLFVKPPHGLISLWPFQFFQRTFSLKSILGKSYSGTYR